MGRAEGQYSCCTLGQTPECPTNIFELLVERIGENVHLFECTQPVDSDKTVWFIVNEEAHVYQFLDHFDE